jgi:serine/threonine-protein kinase
MVQKLLQHQQDPPPSIEALRPDVPKRFGQILGRLMEKDAKDRYQRPADLVADLTTMADDLGIELSSPRPATAAVVVEPAARPSPVHLPWLIPLLGLAAVVGGLWLRSASMATQRLGAAAPVTTRSPAVEPGMDDTASIKQDAETTAVPSPRIWRVVDAPAVDDDCGTVGEAVRQASDGDVIEIACTEPRDDGPFTIDGKRLTIRAADGVEPILRFGEAGAMQRDGSSCTVVSGTLELQGLTSG